MYVLLLYVKKFLATRIGCAYPGMVWDRTVVGIGYCHSWNAQVHVAAKDLGFSAVGWLHIKLLLVCKHCMIIRRSCMLFFGVWVAVPERGMCLQAVG